MNKQIIKRIMSLITASVMMISLNNCDDEVEISNMFNDKAISLYDEGLDIFEETKIYKSIFFDKLPIADDCYYDKDYVDRMFPYDYLKLDFNEAYKFLNNYITYIKDVNSSTLEEIGLDNKEEDKFNNDVLLEYFKDNNKYSLKVINKDDLTEYYEYITLKKEAKHFVFSKSYTYQVYKENRNKEALITTSYELLIKQLSNPIRIVLLSDNTVSKDTNEIKTINEEKRLLLFRGEKLVYDDIIDYKDYNRFVNDLYQLYLNEDNINEYINTYEGKTNEVYKLIQKKQNI